MNNSIETEMTALPPVRNNKEQKFVFLTKISFFKSTEPSALPRFRATQPLPSRYDKYFT